MDLSYWGFQRWPFDRTFAQDRFYSSPIHEEAFARLLFLVEEFRRSGLLTGPAGTGRPIYCECCTNARNVSGGWLFVATRRE